MSAGPRVVVGVSLKMYFTHARTRRWCRAVAGIARHHPAVTSGLVEVFVLPTFPSIPEALADLDGTGVGVGAQDLSWADEGAYTGEVSGAELRELGCTHAEVGHAERRRLLGEDDAVVAAKTAAALRHSLVPVLCVGEVDRAGADAAAEEAAAQVEAALGDARRDGRLGPVVLAYEPVWAIGAAEAAPVDHIRSVARALTAHLGSDPALAGSTVVYGGSAGPGLLASLGADVGGLFLGRSAHDPAAVATVLDEAWGLHGASAPRPGGR